MSLQRPRRPRWPWLAWPTALFLAVVLTLPRPTRAGAEAGGPTFDAARAFNLLKAQVELGPRAPGTPGHDAGRDFLLEFLGERADMVTPHAFSVDDPYGEGQLKLTNIWARFYPERNRRIALAAHWDTRPRADREASGPVDQPIPGANDGAGGVAVLLHLAEILQQHPVPEIGVDLLLFDGEDYGKEGHPLHYLLGSRRFVQDFEWYRPEALILLDLVAGKNLTIPMEGHSLATAPELCHSVFRRAAELGLPAFIPEPGVAVLDDHIPFLNQGIPALDLIDFTYPQWHQLADDVSACDPASLDQVGRLLVSLLYDGFPQAP